MWIMLRDAFFSIVNKECGKNELLVRARRPGDIEKVFGKRDVKVSRDTDYMYRARIPIDEITAALENEVCSIDYGNFKNAVDDPALHRAYMGTWSAMSAVQPLPPYSAPFRNKKRGMKRHVDAHQG